MVVVGAGTVLLDCRLTLLPGLPKGASPLKTGSRVRLYVGTREVTGRAHLLEGRELAEGSSALVQLRLDLELPAAGHGDGPGGFPRPPHARGDDRVGTEPRQVGGDGVGLAESALAASLSKSIGRCAGCQLGSFRTR